MFVFTNTGPAPIVPTITYTVGDRDTLTSVAARFDTTPSELTALNRLGSSFIYSGQTLLVPDKSKIKDDDTSSEASGDTDGSKDKSRKSSSNNDDIPQEEKGKQNYIRGFIMSKQLRRIVRNFASAFGTWGFAFKFPIELSEIRDNNFNFLGNCDL